MSKFVKWIAAAGALCLVVILLLAGGCNTNQPIGNSLMEGVYEQEISELATVEPVRTFLDIRDRLAENDIPSACDQVTDPSVFAKQMSQHRNEVGVKKFKNFYATIRDAVKVHSVHYDGTQVLLVVDTGSEKSSVFFEHLDDQFLEVVDPASSNVSQTLKQQFNAAKGHPDPEYARDFE